MLSRFKMSNRNALWVMCLCCFFHGILLLMEVYVDWQRGHGEHRYLIIAGGCFLLTSLVWLIGLTQSRKPQSSAFLEGHSVLINLGAISIAVSLILNLIDFIDFIAIDFTGG